MRRPFGWAIAGFGWVARDFAVPAIIEAKARVVGVADPSGHAREAAVGRGLEAHADLAPLLADPAVDAVYVASPNDRHRESVERAAAAGKAVLCEKPMAASLEDAEAMANAVRGTGILYGTAFDQRHHPAHERLRALVQDGSVGTLTALRLVYACWLGPDWAPDPAKRGEGTNWRADLARAGGGALMDLAPHGLDLAQFLADEPIVDISALAQRRVQDYAVDDGAVLIGRTASGVLVSLHVAYNHPETLPRRRLEVLGTRALLVAEDTMGQEPGGRILRHDAATGASSPLPFDKASPFERQMCAFMAAHGGQGRDRFDVERDLGTMRLIARAYDSLRCR